MSLSTDRSARPVQLLWLVVAVLMTVLCGGIMAAQWTALDTPCRSACAAFQISSAAARSLRAHGIPMEMFALYIDAVMAVAWAIWYGVAALIIWRKPTDRGAVISAFFLILWPGLGGSVFLPDAHALLADVLDIIGLSALVLFCLLFPDGRFNPIWTRWLAIPGVLSLAAGILRPSGAGIIPFLAMLLAVLGVQVYRYRVIASWEQRQQTKWALFGVVVAVLSFIAIILTYAFPWGANGTLWAGLSTSVIIGLPTAIPISIGIAMLRSRLWDIDRVINRALVYLSLTGILAALYVGGVLGLQALFRLVVGSSSNLAIALSTLAIAALFGPLRRRLQLGIDRRFYRSKYDAARTLAAFGERLRDDVDLNHLSQELTTVVHETLHPAHVSLWLPEQ